MSKYTEIQIEKLCSLITDAADLDTLIQCYYDHILDFYLNENNDGDQYKLLSEAMEHWEVL